MAVKKADITFVIFTYNEEARIERVIKNFIGYGNILIADNKSTDRTQEIARSYGCDILIREKHFVYVENQEMADLVYNKVTTEWIYWSGGADEMLEKKTLDKIISVIESNKYDVISMDRKNYFYGRFCYDMYHSRTNRIFKKHAIDFKNNIIHSMGAPTVPKEKIYDLSDKFFVHHFISNTAGSYVSTVNRYSDSEIQFEYKLRPPILYLIFLYVKGFFTHFIKEKGYKAGFEGIALLEIMVFYKLIKSMKHYEKENNLNVITIEQKNDQKRDAIIRDLSAP